MVKFLRYILIVFIVGGLSFGASAAETAEGMLKKAAAAINGAGGLTASFTLDYGQQRITGTLKAAGKKFAIQTSSSSTWYDGKNMWTYNPKNNETTIITPSAQEVAEANPLSMVNSYSVSFTAAFAKDKTKGSKTIILTPKSKRSGYKSVRVVIPQGSSLPSKLIIVPTSGQTVIVTISQVKRGQNYTDATFTYPKTKYPKTEIIDLR